MNPSSITSLLARIQAKDESALLALHDQYANVVYSVVYHVLTHPQDAEEVTQDVFLRVWNRIDNFDAEKGSFATWLLTVARRMAIDRLRKRIRRDPPPDTISMDEESHLWETLGGKEDISDLQRMLLSALGELSKEQQQAIRLVYFYGMTHSDVAAYLGKPLGTIKSHIRLGMQKLRTIWLNTQPVRAEQDEER